MEIDFLDVWELVLEDDVVVTILCKLCKEIGKEQRLIKSHAKENMMSLGEQHLFFRHQRDPIGFPRKTDFYPLQCSTCQWFFPVQRILDSHAKTCDGAEGRLEATKNGGKERNNNDNVSANKNAVAASKAAAAAGGKVLTKSLAPVVKEKPSVKNIRVKNLADKENLLVKAPVLTSKMRAALKRYNVQPCKVQLSRRVEVESTVKKRKAIHESAIKRMTPTQESA